MELLTLPISVISISGGTQSRVSLNQDAVTDYADALRSGAELPPVVVFNDGASDGLWLADGFHRFHAHRAANLIEIDCDVRVGTQRDAVLFSVGANAAHGLRRTNEDKRKAVATLLSDAEWSTWSDREIARTCGVTHPFVANLRRPKEVVTVTTPEPSEVVTVTTMSPPGRAVEMQEKDPASLPRAIATSLETSSTAPSSVQRSSYSTVDDQGACAGALAPAGELQALREQIEELSESLASTLADNEVMGRVFDADNKLAAAMAEVARHRAIAENAERTLAAKNGEFVERARAVTYWKGQAEKEKKRADRAEKELAQVRERA